MTTVLTLVVSIVVFGVVVLVHEWGHFMAARRSGVHVDEFSIGFGPAIWQKTKNGTVYSIRIIPLGGCNAMSGYSEDSDAEVQAPIKRPKGCSSARHRGRQDLSGSHSTPAFLYHCQRGTDEFCAGVCPAGGTRSAPRMPSPARSSMILPMVLSVPRLAFRPRMRSFQSMATIALPPTTSFMSCSAPRTTRQTSPSCGTARSCTWMMCSSGPPPTRTARPPWSWNSRSTALPRHPRRW